MKPLLKGTVHHGSGDLLIGLTSVLVIALYWYCGFYAVPSADDYAYANILQQGGFWQSQVDSYKGWSGRYTASLLIMWFAVHHMGDYWIVPIATLGLVFSSFFYLYWTLFYDLRRSRHFFLWPVSFFAVFLSSSVAGHGVGVVGEGFFWLSGAATYQLAAVWYFSFCASTIWMARGSCTVLTSGSAAIFAVLCIGSNETVMLLCCMTLVFFLWHYRYRWQPGFFVIVVAVFLSSVAVLAAPGNTVRLETADERSVLSALGICVEKVVESYFYTLINPLLWLFAVYYREILEKMLDTFLSVLSVRLFISGSVALIYSLYFPVAWSLDSGAPDRLVSFIGFITFFTTVFFLHLLVTRLCRRFSLKRLAGFLAVLALAFSPWMNSPLFIAMKTAWSARAFYESHLERDTLVKEMSRRGLDTVTVQPIEKLPLLLFRDLDHPDHAVHYARYHGVQAVHLAE